MVNLLPTLYFLTLFRRHINIARLMPDLPQYVEPLRLARQQAQFAGMFPVSAMHRLTACVYDSSGEVDFELSFFRDASGIHNISGRFSTQVMLVCQRCLQPFQVPVAAGINLGIVRGPEEARLLPVEYDPLEIGAEPLLLLELIEDEVLLALPFAPLHATEHCHPAVASEAGTGPVPERQQPFAELLALKRRRKD